MLAAFTCQNQHLGHCSSEEGLREAVKPASPETLRLREVDPPRVLRVCVCVRVCVGGGGDAITALHASVVKHTL